MKRFVRLIHRAAMAPPEEWACRSQQLLFSCRNWAGSRRGESALPSRGHLRALRLRRDDLADWWKSRQHLWFMDVHRDMSLRKTASFADSGLPWVLSQAELVLQNRMPLFSYGAFEFTREDRWRHDPILKKTAPQLFYGAVPYLDVTVVGDSKHVWEPNRFGWALWLGVAYRVSGDPAYAEKFAELTHDWFDQNPYPTGINYCSALEIALRNYAWVWALDLFSDFLRHDVRLLERLLQGVWIGCRHIEHNLSHYFAPNTHITGEAFSLYACGAGIPEFTDSPKWRSLGLSIMAREATKQFYEDGMHRELSSGYHIYSTDFYLHAALIAAQTGYSVPEQIVSASGRLSTRLRDIAPQDMLMPQFNDCDGGRLTSLVPNPLDAGPSLIAAQMLHRDLDIVPDGTRVRGYPLLMNPRSKTVPRRGNAEVRTHFPLDKNVCSLFDSGLAAYKNDYGDYLLFRSTPFGYLDGPHSHDAPLGVILYLGGDHLFVDNGVGAYTQDLQVRNQFRTATGKNTLLVDGQGPSVPGSFFNWEQTTDSSLVLLRRFTDGIRVRGKHTGFRRHLNCHAFVQREVVLMDEGIVAIVDRWDADRPLGITIRYTLHPDVTVDPSRGVLEMKTGQTVYMAAFGLGTLASDAISPSYDEIPFSPNYGQRVKTSSVSLTPTRLARGGVVTILSRVGKVSIGHCGLVHFEGRSDVRLRITDTSVEPIRTDSGQPVPALAPTTG